MKKYSNFFILVVLLVVASMVLSACKQEQGGQNQTPMPTVEAGWYWKPGGFIDYAPSGMPDFDQKQDQWNSGAVVAAAKWSYCGPVAVANSMWWFDSKYEPKPVAPPTVNDNYKMVESYSYNAAGAAQWDDHDINNVMPFVQDLAKRMDTDGRVSGDGHSGTTVENMSAAIEQYLKDKGLDGAFYVHVQKSPEFSWIAQEVKRCQDVVLLLGFWQLQTDPTHANGQWVRVGGHYVTCAGVNTQTTQIGVSDPYRDNAEAGETGRVPVAHAYPHNSSVHNNTKYVSHDIFSVSRSTSPGGLWKFDNYSDDLAVSNFVGQNWAQDLLSYDGQYNPNLPVQVEIDYAIAVSPVEPTPTPIQTSTPTSTPTSVPPTPTPTPTPTLVPQTPAATPSVTPQGTQTPAASPTPRVTPTVIPTIVPDPSVPVITGIHVVHRANQSGGIDIEIHCLPTYFPKGTNIWDLHFFAGGVYLGSEYFDEPLVACTTYKFHIDTKVPPECITVYLTDQNHKIWGQIGSWLVGPQVPDITQTVITHIDNSSQQWRLSFALNQSYWGQGVTSFFDVYISTSEGCQPIPLGGGSSQSPLVPGETYSFLLDYSPIAPLDFVLIKLGDREHNVIAVAFSWQME